MIPGNDCKISKSWIWVDVSDCVWAADHSRAAGLALRLPIAEMSCADFS